MIYLDNAATTQIDPRVLEKMLPYLKEQYGNPGSLHKCGKTAAGAVAKARGYVAEFLSCNADQVVFTSGGSEGNNLVIRGVADYLLEQGKTEIIISAAEHDSVYHAAHSLIKHGFHIITLPISSDGTVSPRDLEAAITHNTGLASIMYVNNELGSVNDVEMLSGVCAKHGVLFHTDCVQAAGCDPLDMELIGCSFATISSHKIHGPKGAGAVFVKDKTLLSSIVFGGNTQEYGLRAGTENVPAIVGFGEACRILSAQERGASDRTICSALKQAFYQELESKLRERSINSVLTVNGAPVIRSGKILNLRFDGVDNESLMMMLDGFGVAISIGSACHAHDVEPSRVLISAGLTSEQARESIRISFSRDNTTQEVVSAADTIAKCVFTLLHMRGKGNE